MQMFRNFSGLFIEKNFLPTQQKFLYKRVKKFLNNGTARVSARTYAVFGVQKFLATSEQNSDFGKKQRIFPLKSTKGCSEV